jgi:hypothetical protein
MPDCRPDAPSADLFTGGEHLVLCDWFGVGYPCFGRWIDDILDEWNISHPTTLELHAAQIIQQLTTPAAAAAR